MVCSGRRGKDDKGLVIIMLTDKVEPNTAKDMFLGRAVLVIVEVSGSNPGGGIFWGLFF